jgi:hypothetical protein
LLSSLLLVKIRFGARLSKLRVGEASIAETLAFFEFMQSELPAMLQRCRVGGCVAKGFESRFAG